MGYTTDFTGQFNLDKPLTPEHKAYLDQFAGTRRMDRDEVKAAKLPDPIREAVGLPIGKDGQYFVASGGFRGQDHDASVTNGNYPASDQPGLWCQWVPNTLGTAIEWDGGEKFYEYVGWIGYLIHHFLAPWGYTLNGTVEWQGEESSDFGKIVIKDNKISAKQGRRTYDE